ncbi:DNA cytosine methyltransferase [Bacteroides sp. AF18-33]|nr:DNA cytosine methyltransferase [Bacteroides sp. AF18-33]
MNNINLLYIDLFCGAGGTSTGVESAKVNGEQCAKVIACVNHDANAIASHAANHPEAMHFTEDIRTLELSPLIAHVQRMKQLYPETHLVLWASLECTNFSKAKGGQPRDADSRTLAEHLFRYIEAINPDYIQIENVEEFMSWGPMDENEKPISMHKGEDYTRCDGRSLKIHPDVVSDFMAMPFLNESFKLVVFDPPHLLKVGKDSWLAKKYGKLPDDWPRIIKKGVDECFRVLEDYGVLIFKWNEDQITVKEVLKAIERQPLFGHTTGRHGKTMWMCFMKLPINDV